MATKVSKFYTKPLDQRFLAWGNFVRRGKFPYLRGKFYLLQVYKLMLINCIYYLVLNCKLSKVIYSL